MQLTDAFDSNVYFNVVAIAGSIFNAVFTLFIWQMKEIDVHPMRVLISIAGFESLFQYILYMQRYICTFKLNDLFAYTTLFDGGC